MNKTSPKNHAGPSRLLRWSLFFLGFALIPVNAGFLRFLFVVAGDFRSKATPVLSLSAPVGSFIIGAILFTVFFLAFHIPPRFYIWTHELTHAFFGLLAGAKVSHFKIADESGSVRVSETTLLGLLAPYFFPIPAILFLIFVAVLSCFFPVVNTSLGSFLAGVFGFFWAFHGCYTLNAILQYQSDLDTFGPFFSTLFLLALNLLLLCIALAAFSPIGFSAFWKELFLAQGDIFVFLWNHLY